MRIPEGLAPNDIHQWLNGGWFLNVEAGKREACYFQMVDGQEVIWSRAENEGRCRLSDVRAHWPTCGAINLGGYAVVLSRRGVQQYRRTYNSRVLSITVPCKWDVMKAHGLEIPTNADALLVADAAFAQHYYDYADALALLDDSWVTVALNPNIIIAGTSSNHRVYYNGELVGTVNGVEITPIGDDPRVVARLLKFFDGRITLCMSTNSRTTVEELEVGPVKSTALS